NVNKAEGDSGTTDFNFRVSLSNPSYQTITADFRTDDAAAKTSDADYSALTGTLTFSPGETSKEIHVGVNGDTKLEPDDDFFVTLTNPTNATISATGDRAKGTIQNDDPQPPVSIDDVNHVEGDTNTTDYKFTVSLSNPSYRTVKVDLSAQDGSAKSSDADYS